ncbi:DUF2513 domain-containing protein [Guyparkeria sp. SB14A]|uniref:DUF2513 domain-containing protein n=1 Tax=Guyparkeria sp. SB14A TaxID=2571147 RepID=UPI0010ABA398|nr:DUF2513 domain-containing protein [Guyparkeria sp. SB14A]TKA91794.1 DUF2513 domain-containing protein [Guyparkeria sp. SB14A]
MRRDWDTIREILLAVEGLDGTKPLTLEDFEEERQPEISYHVTLLEEAGLVLSNSAPSLRTTRTTPFFVRRLTWDGHELLDQIRDDSVWRQTRQTIMEKGGGMALNVVSSLATHIIKNQIGI